MKCYKELVSEIDKLAAIHEGLEGCIRSSKT